LFKENDTIFNDGREKRGAFETCGRELPLDLG
jgi:hypothetical protein